MWVSKFELQHVWCNWLWGCQNRLVTCDLLIDEEDAVALCPRDLALMLDSRCRLCRHRAFRHNIGLGLEHLAKVGDCLLK